MKYFLFLSSFIVITNGFSQGMESLISCDIINDTTNPHKLRFIDSSEVGKIKFISYYNETYLTYNDKPFHYPFTLKWHRGELKQNKVKNYKFDNVDIDYSRLHELKTITDSSTIASIYEVFGYKYFPDTLSYSGGMLCYYPRNAIIFYDKKGNLLKIFEICFECNHYAMYSYSSYNNARICEDDMDTLYSLFKNQGITFGVTEK